MAATERYSTSVEERYSTSVEERATMRCFLELQETGLRSRYIINALLEVKSSLFSAQSASK